VTFSLLGRCARTGQLGIVISSSSPAVAARCAHARPGVGVAATQNVTDPRLGPALLDELARGRGAAAALAEVVAAAPHTAHRQLVVLDAGGCGAVFTGAAALGTHGARTAPDCAAAGNLLAGERVLEALTGTFSDHPELELGGRLMLSLRAAADAGGEAGPLHSAGMLITAEVDWPVADLRVDWHDEDPIGQLERVWDIYRPQLEAYVARALDPDNAPGYGVPGE
jgi:uncharacterized Ntn-hydrolase superfamily protein